MFDSVGWGEILVLIVAGLFILGPERLPSAAAWVGKTIRQVKEYAGGAREQLRGELGPEFDELRKPLEELRGLRNLNPRTMATNALFGDDEPVKPSGSGTAPQSLAKNISGSGGSGGIDMHKSAAAPPSLAKNERPPIDDDAT